MKNKLWDFYGHRHDEPISAESNDILERIKDWADEHKALPLGIFLTEIAVEIERLRAVLEKALGFAHVAALFNGGRSEGNLVAGFMEWAEAHDSLLKENEELRRCLQHAIDHVGKWELFTAEEKQAVLTEYKEAVCGE